VLIKDCPSSLIALSAGPAVQDKGWMPSPVVIADYGKKRFDARSRFVEVELEVHRLDQVIGRTVIFE
jgi:hypothetical protein